MLVCNVCNRSEEEVKIRKTGICVKCKSKIDYENNREKKLKRCKEYYENNKEIILERNKIYYENNKEIILVRHKEYQEENVEKYKEYYDKYKITDKAKERGKRYSEKNREYKAEKDRKWREENKEHVREFQKKYSKENKEKINKYRRNYECNRFRNDMVFRLKLLVSSSIRKAFYTNKLKKNGRTEIILGKSFEDFKLYLESKFEPWMNWENQGRYNGEFNYGWDIDHIIPISSAKTEDDIIRLNHYTNLQPLCSKINRHIKRDTIL